MKSETATATASARNSAELVGRIRTGDDSAWRDLVDQYEPLLRWLARHHGLSAEDANDAVQLTWLRCLEHIGQLADADKLRSWLITICRRESIRLATKGRREVPVSEPDVARLVDDGRSECDPCTETVRRDERDRLYRAITALPERQRIILVELLRPEGQSYLDISRRLGFPVGSIGPTWQRAITRLRRDPQLADAPQRYLTITCQENKVTSQTAIKLSSADNSASLSGRVRKRASTHLATYRDRNNEVLAGTLNEMCRNTGGQEDNPARSPSGPRKEDGHDAKRQPG